MSDEDPRIRQSINDLSAPTPERRARALAHLASVGPAAAPAVGRIVASLNDPHPVVRQTAASALTEVGPEARAAVPALILALADVDAVLRRRVCVALGEIGEGANAAVPALIKALQTDDSLTVKRHAAAALGELGAAAAVGPLVETLGSEDIRLRAVVAVALARLGRRAVPRLIETLRHPSPTARAAAVRVLGKGEWRCDAAGPLAALLTDADPSVREAAAEALRDQP